MAAAFERLFSTYPQFGGRNDGAFDRIAAAKVYFEAVAIFEAGDIEQAVENFLTGAAPGHNPAFAPPAPLVGSEVRRVMNLRVESEARARRFRPALPAPDIVHTPEERERVRLKVEALKASIAERTGDDEAATEKQRRSNFAKVHERFRPDMDEDAVLERLGYTVGDADGEAA